MQTYFYKLSGGINQSCSKTTLGLDTSKLYWGDSQNIEILQGNGLIRQNGNSLFAKLSDEESISAIHRLHEGNKNDLLITTSLGNIYIFNTTNGNVFTVDKTLTESALKTTIVDFLDGVVIGSESDSPFYINNDDEYEVEECNLKDTSENPILSSIICVYAGRLWIASGATLYFSALGKYNDFTTENDAGFINNFHTDINYITALKTYKEYLAIYKENSVYLLSGTNQENFEIKPFADKGTASNRSVINVNNRQYFINQGIFCLEQSGLLSQIQLGEEVSLNIKQEFEKFDKSRFDEIIIINYETKNQVWFFIPYKNDRYFHTIWIFDYIEKAWFKRVLPQDITTACLFKDKLLTADSIGNIYQEDFGNTFDGKPIDFFWKSPFIASGKSNVRKTIEEFYFVLDETFDNDFNFSVYKDYDEKEKSDEDKIASNNYSNLIWGDSSEESIANCNWGSDSTYSQWAVGAESIYKAEISESNYSVQLCIDGNSIGQSTAIIGLEFKQVYFEE